MGPFIVSDSYLLGDGQPTHFNLAVDTGTPFDVPAYKNPDNSVILHHDVGGIANGRHTVLIKAVVIDPIWGRAESTQVPFSFERPGISTIQPPQNIRLRMT